MSRLIKTIADGETTYREAKQFWVSKSMIGESYDRFAHDAEQYDDDIPVIELAYVEQLEKENAELKSLLAYCGIDLAEALAALTRRGQGTGGDK